MVETPQFVDDYLRKNLSDSSLSQSEKSDLLNIFRINLENLIRFKAELAVLNSDISLSEFKNERYGDLENDKNYNHYFYESVQFYNATILFPTEYNKNRLADYLNIPLTKLKWFTGFKEVVSQVQKIKESCRLEFSYSDIIIPYFNWYLPTKIRSELFIYFKKIKKYDDLNKNQLQIGLFKYNQNIKKNPNRVLHPKNEFEVFMNDLNSLLKLILPNISEDLSVKKFFDAEASGNVESIYLKPIIKSIINNNSNKYKKEEIYILLFDLFRVLLINKKWLTEGEFYDSESLYKNSYRNYQLQIFKNFMRS